MKFPQTQPASFGDQPDSLENLLAGEIEQIKIADLPKPFIVEEIAALRKRFSQGIYRPGTSPLLQENIEKPLGIEVGRKIPEAD